MPKARREFPTGMAFWLFFARKNLLKERLRDKIIRKRGICLHTSGGDMDENSGRRRRTACDQFSDPYLMQSGTGLRLYQCDDHRRCVDLVASGSDGCSFFESGDAGDERPCPGSHDPEDPAALQSDRGDRASGICAGSPADLCQRLPAQTG